MSQSQSNITGFFRSATSVSSVCSSITPSQSSPSPLQPAAKKIRSRSPESDEEEVGDDDDDLTLKCLKLEPGDMPYEAWLVRVVNAAGRIGFICRCCRVSEPPGIWTTKPLYVNSGRMQAIKRHGTECHAETSELLFSSSGRAIHPPRRGGE